MSTKNKNSSKGKKVSAKKVAPKKVVKKAAPKKVVKKAVAKKSKPVKKVAAKPVAKKIIKKATPKKVVKKAVAKKAAPKKVVAKKIVKAKVVKKAAPKKVVKKAAAPKKIVKKAITKKVAPKKIAKPVVKAKPAKKVVAKKIVAPVKKAVEVKPVAVVAPKVEKPVVVKQPVTKTLKAVKKVIAKAPIVAPTTFRVDEAAQMKNIKEPAGKFEMEFVIRASEDMVFEFVSTESGLSEWFCDDVNIRNGIFTFTWDGQPQQARLVKEQPPLYIRYQWLDKNDGSYFEFRTQKDELTNDISLIVTDFADTKADEISAKLLWESQIDKLLHVLGSFF